MATKFWVGGTGSWSDTTHWATLTGGAGSTGIPVTGDNVTFDGASGGGTVTADVVSGLSFGTVNAGAFTGTLDFSGTNPNLTITGTLSITGTSTRTINLGSGTFTFTGTGSTFTSSNVTGLTPTFQNASFVFTANTASTRSVDTGATSMGPVTISNNSTKGLFTWAGGGTLSSMTIGSGNVLSVTQLTTITITNALTMTGTSSAPVGLLSSTQSNNATISVGSASTIDYGSIYRITKAGAGSIAATNSFDLTGNSGVTITGPSSGGGGAGAFVGA